MQALERRSFSGKIILLSITIVHSAPSSAGAIHSPQVRCIVYAGDDVMSMFQILLLSGVGPSEQLRTHNIPVIVDLPGVGSNLVDHPAVSTIYAEKAKTLPMYALPHSLWQVFQLLWATVKYLWTGTGPFTTNVKFKVLGSLTLLTNQCPLQWAEAAAFVRSDDPHLFPKVDYPANLQSSTSSPTCPDLEIYIAAAASPDHGKTSPNLHAFTLGTVLIRCVVVYHDQEVCLS
jgi:choline dehydrogenase